MQVHGATGQRKTEVISHLNIGPDGKIGTGVVDKWVLGQESGEGKWYMGNLRMEFLLTTIGPKE